MLSMVAKQNKKQIKKKKQEQISLKNIVKTVILSYFNAMCNLDLEFITMLGGGGGSEGRGRWGVGGGGKQRFYCRTEAGDWQCGPSEDAVYNCIQLPMLSESDKGQEAVNVNRCVINIYSRFNMM